MNADEEVTWNTSHSENELLRRMEKISQQSPALLNLEVIVRHGTRGLIQLMNSFKSAVMVGQYTCSWARALTRVRSRLWSAWRTCFTRFLKAFGMISLDLESLSK